MRRTIFSISALSFVLMFAPIAPAQQNLNDSNDFVIENLCAPDFPEEFDQQEIVSGLDYDQLEQVRIELLERGFDPGFDPYRDNTLDGQLMDALTQFQAAYELPVTGRLNIPTLVALSFPTQQLRDQNS